MRTKLLLSAAVAAALGAPAFADLTPPPVPEKTIPVFEPHEADPEKPEVKADLTAGDISALFNNKETASDETDGRFNQEAIIFQEGGEDGRNDASIDQTASTEGLASVEQRGSSNFASVVQTNTGGPGSGGQFVNPANIAVVDQNGNGNTARVRQFDGPSAAPSVTEANIVAVHQYSDADGSLGGDVNTAEVEQNGSFNVSTQITQGSEADGGQNNTAFVLQSGSGNSDIDIAQNFDGNFADASQLDAWRSSIKIEQNGFGTDANNTAIVSQQDGEGLEAHIVQGGGSAGTAGIDNNAVILQTGTDNVTAIAQVFDGNTATVDQSGARNDIAIEQGSGFFVENANTADVVQGGWNNEIDVYQTADGNDANFAVAVQSGESNELIVNQDAGDGGQNFADANQSGYSNALAVIQVNDGTGTAGFNDAAVSQSGSENELNVSQDGSGNIVTADQSGWGNTLAIAQVGDSNIADATQSGESNELTIVQGGEFNVAFATQAGGSNEAHIEQDGASNTAELTQTTYGNSAHIFQTNYETGFVAEGTNVANVSQTYNSNQAALVVQYGAANTANISQ